MGKILRFLSIFSTLFIIGMFGAMAAGYNCPTLMTYTMCNSGYYMATQNESGEWAYNGTAEVGNDCLACPTGCSCEGGTAAPVCGQSCDAGKYWSAGACKTCRGHFYCLGFKDINTPDEGYGRYACPDVEDGWNEMPVSSSVARVEDCYERKTGTSIPGCTAGQIHKKAVDDNTWGSEITVYTALKAAAGHYVSDDGLSCPACEDGKICTGSTAAPETCPAGTHPNSTQTTCESCAAGTHWNATSKTCEVCTTGICDGSDDTEKDCQIGTYVNSEHTACIACTGNTYSDAKNSTQCKTCPANSAANALHTACTCNDGFVWNESGTKCIQTSCQPGEYLKDGICTTCESGYACGGDGTTTKCLGDRKPNATKTECVLDCGVGHYDNSVDNTCAKCPAGSISLGGASKECTECVGNNNYANNNQSMCIMCEPGSHFDGEKCDACPAGQICDDPANPTTCTIQNSEPNAARTECVCKTGFEWNSDKSVCRPTNCAPGTYSNGIECIKCDSGSHFDGEKCVSCPAGQICSDPVNPTTCTIQNSEPNTARTECVCKTGFEWNSDHTKCIQTGCQPGKYINNDGICTVCETGYACPDGGTTTKCLGDRKPNTAKTECVLDCATGYFDNGLDNVCTQCQDGWISSGGAAKECTKCATGTHPNVSKSQCESCPAGEYFDGTQCVTCEPGKICTDDVPQDCPAGKHPNAAATACIDDCAGGHYDNGTMCVACPANTISAGGTVKECTPCASGTHPNANATQCLINCTGGQYHDGTQCVTCEPGTLPNADRTACVECPVGQVCNEGIPEKCPDGTTPNDDATACETCAEGNVCKDGISTSCPAGYTSRTGATSNRDCFINIAAGQYLTQAQGSTTAACPLGTARAAHTIFYGDSDSCIECQSRKYYADTEGLAKCKTASNGNFYGGEQTTGCDVNGNGCTGVQLCEPRFWCKDGAETPCPSEDGWKPSTLYGTNMRALCYETQTPEGCASGTVIKYASEYGGWQSPRIDGDKSLHAMPGRYVSDLECPVCPIGTVSEGGTSEQCDICEDGTYPNDTSSQCIACPLGQICRNGIPEDCPAGTAPNDMATACEECPAGHICNPGAPAIRCADGTYPDETKTMCITCPAGMRCDGGIAENCPAGYTSNTGAKNATECFTTCTEYALDGGTAIPVNGKVFYPSQCEYTGIADDGIHPCDIVDNKCVIKWCKPEYELINGKCRACNRDGAEAYKQAGNCQIERCRDGLHPNGDMCVQNTRECALPNAISAIEDWDFAKKGFMACHPTECAAGYHVEDTVCVPDEQACRVENGVGTQEWDSVRNTWGKCIATSCDPGYTNNWDETNEHTKQCGVCKNKYSLAGEVAARYGNSVTAYNDNLPAASSYVRGCEIASCMYQGTKYALEDNFCRPICTNGTDETGTRHWTGSKCEISCNSGFTQW